MNKIIKPVFIDTRYLRPLPKAMWGVCCAHCGKPKSRWELHEPTILTGPVEETGPAQIPEPPKESLPICSMCFLYESNWGQRRREEIDTLIEETEKDAEGTFLRDVGGRLLDDDTCDNIMASIAFTSRLIEMRMATTEFRRAAGKE